MSADNTGVKQDTKFKKGFSGNPKGRPKGSISIKDKIRRHLEDNPDKLEELVTYYMENEQPVMRKLLWEMLDGKPAQDIAVEGEVTNTIELTDEQLERIIRKRGEQLAS